MALGGSSVYSLSRWDWSELEFEPELLSHSIRLQFSSVARLISSEAIVLD